MKFENLDSLQLEQINGGSLTDIMGLLGQLPVFVPGYIPIPAKAVLLVPTLSSAGFGLQFKNVDTCIKIPAIVPISISSLMANF